MSAVDILMRGPCGHSGILVPKAKGRQLFQKLLAFSQRAVGHGFDFVPWLIAIARTRDGG